MECTGENEGNESKKRNVWLWEFATRDNSVCVRERGWWLFTDALRAEIVGGRGRERPAQLSGVDWPV